MAFLPMLFALVAAGVSRAAAGDFATTLFADEFNGTKLKKEWGSWKSETVVRDGVMVGITPETADHPSVNSLKLPSLADLEVAVSFQFQGSPRFSVMFRDLSHQGSHAGHICHVAVSPTRLGIYDGKQGIFRKDIRDRRKAGKKLDGETQAMLQKTIARAPLKLDSKAWHDLLIRIESDVLTVSIDGKVAGKLKSAGIGHQTKSNMNITTMDREVHYDHFAIRTR